MNLFFTQRFIRKEKERKSLHIFSKIFKRKKTETNHKKAVMNRKIPDGMQSTKLPTESIRLKDWTR